MWDAISLMIHLYTPHLALKGKQGKEISPLYFYPNVTAYKHLKSCGQIILWLPMFPCWILFLSLFPALECHFHFFSFFFLSIFQKHNEKPARLTACSPPAHLIMQYPGFHYSIMNVCGVNEWAVRSNSLLSFLLILNFFGFSFFVTTPLEKYWAILTGDFLFYYIHCLETEDTSEIFYCKCLNYV